jgi:hypothetical protein
MDFDNAALSMLIHFRAEIVRWVTESARPFEIVRDRGWESLMKTGRPGYWTPSPKTVACDVRQVFVRSRQRIANLLKVGDVHPSAMSDADELLTEL